MARLSSSPRWTGPDWTTAAGAKRKRVRASGSKAEEDGAAALTEKGANVSEDLHLLDALASELVRPDPPPRTSHQPLGGPDPPTGTSHQPLVEGPDPSLEHTVGGSKLDVRSAQEAEEAEVSEAV
eukprot:70266-Prorocentrum_minimum.AAC.1